MRTYAPSPSVRDLPYPIYLMGKLMPPGLGQTEAKILGGSAPYVSTSLTEALGPEIGAWAGPVGAAAGVLIGIVAGLLAGHEQRAKDAKNENQAADSAAQTFDQVIKQIVSSYNSGQAGAAECVQALQQLQSVMLETLQSKVGPPGTAWNNAAVYGQGTPCNSGCTVGCCLYYNDLAPAMIMMTQALEALGGALTAAQSLAQSFPAFGPASASGSGGIATSFTLTIPEIYPSKYSDYSRAAYQVTLTTPPSSVSSDVSSLVGGTVAEGGASNLLPLLGIGLLAYLVL